MPEERQAFESGFQDVIMRTEPDIIGHTVPEIVSMYCKRCKYPGTGMSGRGDAKPVVTAERRHSASLNARV